MTLPRTAGDVLADHVTLEVECIDRMYLNVYVPALMHVGGVVGFWREHRGHPIASSALMDPMTKAYVAAVRRFAASVDAPIVGFEKGQRKDDVAAGYRSGVLEEGVYLVGRAQERARVIRTEKRRNPETGKTYPWLVQTTSMVNQYYFYAIDEDFGPFFFKFSTYFPYTAKLCINANEWAKCQAAKAGISFEALDNGFAGCDDPEGLQAICSSFGPAQIEALARKWLARLPDPFCDDDRAAGYRYDLSVLQAEFSLTQVLDRPLAGRVFFEDIIRENLDLGRPDKVSLIFGRRVRTRGRRPTPSRFRTRVLTNGVIPSLHVDYKSSKIKQYHKEGRALRTETTINNPVDFGVRKRLEHLPELCEIGFTANRRLLDVQRASRDPIAAEAVLDSVAAPQVIDGQRVPALRFGDRRVHALMSTLVLFRLCYPDGFSNRDLRPHMADLCGIPTATMTAGKMTYDLRRLRLHGLITRRPHSNRYDITDLGLQVALWYTRTHNRLVKPVLADLTTDQPTPIRRAYHQLCRTIDDHAQHAGLLPAA
jgi:hypothetical protein